MKSLVVILGFLIAAVQAAPGKGFSDGPTPLNVYMPITEGAPKVQAPKIVGGYQASVGQFPHHGALIADGGIFCGCSLISPNYVLTAAHCVLPYLSFQVILGRLQWNGIGGISVMSSNKTAHKDYKPDTLANDIALIRLPSPVSESGTIKHVGIPTSTSNTYVNSTALVSGYGLTSQDGGISPTLNFVDLLVISNNECILYYGNVVVSTTLCASGAGGKGICSGDSGGALVISNGLSYTQIGIASFTSIAGCASGYPSGYTRITGYLPWLKTNAGVGY